MGEWAATVYRLIQILVMLAGVLFSVGMAWNLTQIIISVGLDGLPRVLPQVLLDTVGMLFGFLIIANAFKIATSLAAFFMTPIFRLP